MTLQQSNVHWARPDDERSTGTGVVVVAGSSGRLDAGRADMLAGHGVTALALRWFGGEGQPGVPCEIPLETFIEANDLLAAECARVVLMGHSYGAEAALLTATLDQRVDAVVALAPTDVAWEGQNGHDDDPRRSKWTYQGDPIPFVSTARGSRRRRCRPSSSATSTAVPWSTRTLSRLRRFLSIASPVTSSSSSAVTTRCGRAARQHGTSLPVATERDWARSSSKTIVPGTPSCCRAKYRPT